jgi:hypothetical protein
MVLRLITCSPRRRIRLVTVAGGLKAHRNPVGLVHLRRLDASNGRQDHTALPYALAPLVHAPAQRSRAFAQWKARPAFAARDDATASTASHPNVRDDGQRPSEGRDGGDMSVIWVKREAKHFNEAGWTARQPKDPTGKSVREVAYRTARFRR